MGKAKKRAAMDEATQPEEVEDYEVEKIVDKRQDKGGRTQYSVRWLGYGQVPSAHDPPVALRAHRRARRKRAARERGATARARAHCGLIRLRRPLRCAAVRPTPGSRPRSWRRPPARRLRRTRNRSA